MKGVSNLNRSDTRRCVRRLIESGAPLTGAGRRRGLAMQSPTSGVLVQWCVFRKCASNTVPNGAATFVERLGCVLGHPCVNRSEQRNVESGDSASDNPGRSTVAVEWNCGAVTKALNLARTRAASQLGSTPFCLSCATWPWHQCALESNRFGLDLNAAKRT